jgi:formylglycine-generating enzyme required for sulfatase activity
LKRRDGITLRSSTQVTISNQYYLGIYEVTQGQYEKVMGTNPSYFQKDVIRIKLRKSDSSLHPVEQVSWEDAVEFCKRLSELPGEKKAERVYRLPTEAEWNTRAEPVVRRLSVLARVQIR